MVITRIIIPTVCRVTLNSLQIQTITTLGRVRWMRLNGLACLKHAAYICYLIIG